MKSKCIWQLDLISNSMIKLLFLQVALTFVCLMVWIKSTQLSSGEVGMLPLVFGVYLLIQLFIGIILSIFFRKKLHTAKNLIIGIIVSLLIYEVIPFFDGNKPMLLGIFDDGPQGEINRAVSLIPIIPCLIIIRLIAIVKK